MGLPRLKARRRRGWSSGGSRGGICFLALPALGGAHDASSTPSSIFSALLPTWAPPSQGHQVDVGDPPHPQLLPRGHTLPSNTFSAGGASRGGEESPATDREPETAEDHFLPGWKAESEVRVWAGLAPTKGPGDRSPRLFQLLRLQVSPACGLVTPVSASIDTRRSSPL